MKIIVKKELCQGHAMCQYKSPEVFELNEHGYNTMDPFTVPAGQEEAARRGAAACPEGAIVIVED
jgi:ferredoxin